MSAEPVSVADGAAAMSERWVQACRLDAFESRQIVPAFVEGQHLVLIRNGDRFFAAERGCPHEGADLAWGRCSAARLFCPRHDAWFDLRDGAVSPGWSFPALRVYRVRVIGDGLWVDLSTGMSPGSDGAAASP